MPEPLRVSGFMNLARGVVANEPGLTAKEVYSKVARLAQAQGIPISAAPDPERSLTNTLNKYYEDFGMGRRRGMDRIYRYYLK